MTIECPKCGHSAARIQAVIKVGIGMNIRFYHAKILLTKADHTFEVTEGELWVRGDHICYIGDGTDTSAVCKEDDIIIWDREIDAKGNLLMPGFKNAHTHTPMTFLRSFADDLPLREWLQQKVFPNEARLKGEDTYWLAILGIMEYLTSGITSNFDMYIMQTIISMPMWIQVSGLFLPVD